MMMNIALEGLAHLEQLRMRSQNPAGVRRGGRRIAMQARQAAEHELRCIDSPLVRHGR